MVMRPLQREKDICDVKGATEGAVAIRTLERGVKKSPLVIAPRAQVLDP